MGSHSSLAFTGESSFQVFSGGAGFRPSTVVQKQAEQAIMEVDTQLAWALPCPVLGEEPLRPLPWAHLRDKRNSPAGPTKACLQSKTAPNSQHMGLMGWPNDPKTGHKKMPGPMDFNTLLKLMLLPEANKTSKWLQYKHHSLICNSRSGAAAGPSSCVGSD